MFIQLLNSAAIKMPGLASKCAGRFGKVEDIMGAVFYLASDASLLVTGSSLMIDGGWTAA